MSPLFIALALFGGAGARCGVVFVAHQAAHYQAVSYAPVSYQAVSYTPYFTASSLQYTVADPERDALYRILEKQSDALIIEVKESRERAARFEQAAATGSGDAPPPLVPRAAAQTLLRQHCAQCHTGEKAKGGFTLSAAPTPLERILVGEVVGKGKMPPKDQKQLSGDERKMVSEWSAVTTEEIKAAIKRN